MSWTHCQAFIQSAASGARVAFPLVPVKRRQQECWRVRGVPDRLFDLRCACGSPFLSSLHVLHCVSNYDLCRLHFSLPGRLGMPRASRDRSGHISAPGFRSLRKDKSLGNTIHRGLCTESATLPRRTDGHEVAIVSHTRRIKAFSFVHL
jgi:hypothetical protein